MKHSTRNPRLLAGLALAAAASLTLTACGGDTAEPGGSASGGGGGEQLAVTLITKTATNPFFIAMQKGAEEAGKANNVEITTAAGKEDGDEATQIQAIEAAMARGDDGILITPATDGVNPDIGETSILALMKTVDDYIPQPERPIDQPFLMPVEDVFSISGRGTVVTGAVERGVIKVGEEIEIVGIRPTVKTICTGVEMFRKLLDQGQAGDNVGVLLRGTKREEVERGQVLCKPGSIKPHTHFTAEVYVLSKDEGGRHTPFFNNYRPQFYFRTTDVTGAIELPQDKEMVMPGDNVSITVKLINPIAMEEGLRFAIREGGRTVGSGVVAKILA